MNGENLVANAIALEILTSGIKLPPLPAAGTRLLEMTQKSLDKIDISSFAALVETDPGLLSKVLQLANSPYYGSVNKIVGLRKAIIRIGLDEAINSVCLYFFQKMIPKIPAIDGFSVKEYWAHSWACAMANRRLGHPNLLMDAIPGELYIAGLLHGIGKLILAIHNPWEFSKCIAKAKNLKLPLHEVEMDIFGTTDALLTAKIMEMWNFPEAICAAVAFYNNPESAPEAYREIAGLTQFAYFIAGISEIGNSGDGILMDIRSVWICKQPGLKFNEAETQQFLVQEIMLTLEEKSESTTGVAPKRDCLWEHAEKNHAGKAARGNSTFVNHRPRQEKKGFFARIFGFFGGR